MIQQVLRPAEVDCLVCGSTSTTGTCTMNDDVESEQRQTGKTCPVCQVHRMDSKRFVPEIRSGQFRSCDCTGLPPGGREASRQRQTDESASCYENRFRHGAEPEKQNLLQMSQVFSRILVSCRRNSMPFVAIKMGRRQGARSGAYLNRYATDEQRGRGPIFIATLRAAASWLLFRVARSLRIDLDMLVARALRSSQPTCGERHVIPATGHPRIENFGIGYS
jgi:hypothetical protein